MARTRSARLLALSGLMAALGCHSTPAPVVTTPLLPETVIPALPPDPLASAPMAVPAFTAGKDKQLILPPGAQLPKPGDLGGPVLPGSKIAKLPDARPLDLGPSITGPDLPAPVVPPKDVAPILASQLKPIERPTEARVQSSPVPVIKPLLIEPPHPPAGPDGFAPAPIIPPPTPAETYPPPKIVNKPEEPALPIKPGDRFGHSADYKWIAGVLDRHVKGGYWTLRYADYSADDEWGGKMRLLDDPRLNDFKDGDQVYIEGELLAPHAAASAEGTSYPPYRINKVRPVQQH